MRFERLRGYALGRYDLPTLSSLHHETGAEEREKSVCKAFDRYLTIRQHLVQNEPLPRHRRGRRTVLGSILFTKSNPILLFFSVFLSYP